MNRGPLRPSHLDGNLLTGALDSSIVRANQGIAPPAVLTHVDTKAASRRLLSILALFLIAPGGLSTGA